MSEKCGSETETATAHVLAVSASASVAASILHPPGRFSGQHRSQATKAVTAVISLEHRKLIGGNSLHSAAESGRARPPSPGWMESVRARPSSAKRESMARQASRGDSERKCGIRSEAKLQLDAARIWRFSL